MNTEKSGRILIRIGTSMDGEDPKKWEEISMSSNRITRQDIERLIEQSIRPMVYAAFYRMGEQS